MKLEVIIVMDKAAQIIKNTIVKYAITICVANLFNK
jgi:hypothetical protein